MRDLTVLARGFLVWLVIAFAETLHGIARGLLLQPHLGDHRARQVAVFTGSAIILAIATLFVGWIAATSAAQLLGVGALWLGLMLSFELGVGRALGLSWERLWSDYDPRQGGLLGLGMAALLFAPLLAARIRKIRLE